MINLTLNEQNVMSALAEDRVFTYFDDGKVEDSDSWSNVFTDEVAIAIGKDVKAARGVVSSLIKKGLFVTGDQDQDGEDGVPIVLTKLGADIIEEIRNPDLDDLDEVDLDGVDAEEEVVVPEKVKEVAKRVVAGSSGRFDHSHCNHARSGKEGKIARAKCRREHEAALKAAAKAVEEEKANA